MPGLTGIDVARRIAGRASVVFVTAYGDHALAAFDAGAVDYVLKPVDPARLAQAVARVRHAHGSPHPRRPPTCRRCWSTWPRRSGSSARRCRCCRPASGARCG